MRPAVLAAVALGTLVAAIWTLRGPAPTVSTIEEGSVFRYPSGHVARRESVVLTKDARHGVPIPTVGEIEGILGSGSDG